MSGLLEGKVALVTGAGRGIGREIALMMAAHGAAVVVNDPGVALDGRDDETDGPARTVVKEITAAGGRAVADFGSVAEAAQARAMVRTAVEEFGRIDIVVNNAGILRDVIFHKMTDEDWDAVIKVHLYGSFNVSRAAAEHFRAQSSGAFVHMTSTSGLVGNPARRTTLRRRWASSGSPSRWRSTCRASTCARTASRPSPGAAWWDLSPTRRTRRSG